MMATVDDAHRTQPLIAVDVVPVAFDGDSLLVGTAARRFEPFAGRQALPGVLLGSAELLDDAAGRALADKAGIHAPRTLVQLGAFDRPGRDPRSHAISIAFLAVTDPAAGTAQWAQPDELPALPFDHRSIVAAALDVARIRLWRDAGLTRALLGETFTTRDASRLELVITGRPADPGNMHRQLTKDYRLRQSQQSLPSGRGRPAAVWTWTERA